MVAQKEENRKEQKVIPSRKWKGPSEVMADCQAGSMLNVRVRHSEYAKYGVTEGSMKTGVDVVTCSVVSGGFSSWAFGAQGAGMQVKDILLFNNEWAMALGRVLPRAQVISFVEEGETNSVRMVELEEVDYVLSDIDPPGRANVWGLAQNGVITTRRCRRTPRGWKEKSIEVSHPSCGGVSSLVVHAHVYTREGIINKEIHLPITGLRDLSMILDSRARHGTPSPAPPVIAMEVLGVMEVPESKGTFHGSGWLPGGRRDVKVLAPNVFSPTKWCRRRLTNDEWLHILDFPVDVMKSLSEEEKLKLARHLNVIPIKILTSICQGLNERELRMHKAMAHDGEDEREEAATQGEKLDAVAVSAVYAAAEIDRVAKATKADDAEVPEYLWDDRLLQGIKVSKTEVSTAVLTVLRTFFLRGWKKRVTTSLLIWWRTRRNNGDTAVPAFRLIKYDQTSGIYVWAGKGKKQYKAMRNQRKVADREIADDALEAIPRSSNASWWEWTEGSFPFFWRWPEWYQPIREGCPPWLRSAVPKCAIPQRPKKDERTSTAIWKKIQGPIAKGYLEKGDVHSLTSFFAVPKGPDDIRLVYDGTKSGLNDAMFAPWFPLPTVDQLLRVVEKDSYMGDIDVGEMFLNCVMHKRLRIYCGVDVTQFFPELKESEHGTVWLRWSRCGMGFKNSPNVTTQGMAVAEEVMLGDPSDKDNVFRWDEVMLNLPGMEGYDPSKAWVVKLRLDSGQVACDVFIYVDDVRTVGPTEEECWQVSRTTASILNWLGLQDVARKRRPPSQAPGAWAGSIVHSSSSQMEVMISQEQ